MSATLIQLYCLRAARFALPCGAVWLALRLSWQALRRRKIRAGRECLLLALVVYLAALLQITVWRGGIDLRAAFVGGARQKAQLTLFHTTLDHWRAGPRYFIYHFVGNLAWFVPLGLLLPPARRRWNFAETLLLGLLLSAGIEALQWLLGTGVTDVDDVMINGLGAALGYGLAALCRRLSRRGGAHAPTKNDK